MTDLPAKRRFRMRELTILASVVLAIAVFGSLNHRFLGLESALAVLEGASSDGLMVIGMTIVIICGAFDMSVGSAMAFCGLVAALCLQSHWPIGLAVVAALAAGTFVGWVNGTIVTRLKINPFITTLGMMSILRGVVQVVTRSSPPTGFPPGFLRIAWGTVFTIHLPWGPLEVRFPVVLLVGAMIAGDFLLRRLAFLRQVYFVGSNEEAARLTGIPTARVKTFAFMLTGFLAGLTGVIVTSRVNAIDANAGMGAELRVIAAVIVGGASLSGGRGTILGSFLGLLLMQIITTGLVFIDVAAEAQQIAVGLVLILAAVIALAGSGFGRTLRSLFRTRNKTMERIIIAVLAVVLVVVLVVKVVPGRPGAAGPQAVAAGPAQHYVLITAVTGAPYWIDSKQGFYDKAKELGVNALFAGPPTVDANAEIESINRAVAQKVDGIVVCAVADSVAPAIDKAVEAGIPVVCADADSPSSRRFSFIGTGNYNAGYRGGEELARLLGGRGEVALMYIPGWDNLIQRVQGYKDGLAKFPDIKVVKVGNDKGSQTEAEKECRAILQAFPNLAGFGCVAAVGGQGAAVAVKQAGRAGKVKIVAMDRDEATLQFIQEGVIDASLAQRTYMMTYLALQMLYDVRNDRIKFTKDWRGIGVNPLPPVVDTGTFVIDKSNVASFRRNK
jgi:ribose transport system substrate-binding protein